MVKKYIAAIFSTFSLFLIFLQLSAYLFFLLTHTFSEPTEIKFLYIGILLYNLILGIPLSLIGFILNYPHIPSYWALKIHLLIIATSPILAIGYFIFNQ